MSQPMSVPTKPPSGKAPASRAPEATIPPTSKSPPRPSGRVVKDTTTAPPRQPGLPRLPSLEMQGEAPEVYAEIVEVEAERLRDDAAVVKPRETEHSSKPPPLPGKTNQLHLVPPPPLPGQGASSAPPVPARASSIPPIPTTRASSVPPPHVTSSFPALSAQATPTAPPVSPAMPSSPVATRPPAPPAPVIPPGVDEVRALLGAAKGVVGELDHMIQEMERRLSDPTRWSVQAGATAASPDMSAAFAKAALPPPPAPPVAALPSVMAPPAAGNWWEDEKHRRFATFGVAFSLAVGLGGLVMALFGSC
jgi:hypothetical protein